MTNSASAWIRVGGPLPRNRVPALLAAIDADGGLTDWDGQPLASDALADGCHLDVYALNIRFGAFAMLEAFCMAHQLAFVRSSGGSSGMFGPEKVVFAGKGTPSHFNMLEDGEVCISRQKASALASMEAIMAWFEASEFQPPYLTLTDDGEEADG